MVDPWSVVALLIVMSLFITLVMYLIVKGPNL
jgi:multisubunit Na+/H+ antiporter MnhF subunit